MIETLSKVQLARKDVLKILKQARLMNSQLEFLQSFVNDLLDHTKLKSGSLTLESMPFSVESVLKNIHEIFQP